MLRVPANRTVVDATGLDGLWEATLDFAAQGDESGNKPSIFTALQDQLGLKLEPSTAPLDVLIIDAIQRPTPN
jgi:bla regulator protein blaR1